MHAAPFCSVLHVWSLKGLFHLDPLVAVMIAVMIAGLHLVVGSVADHQEYSLYTDSREPNA